MLKEMNAVATRQTVLLVHNFYLIGGGEHTVYENEKRLLEANGHRVFIYTRDNHELNTCLWKKLLLPFTTVFSFKTYREVKRSIRENGIEIVHCHNTFPLISPSVYFAAHDCHVPVVQTIHNFRFLCPCGILYRDGRICEECLEKGLHCALKHGCYRGSRLQTMAVVNMLRIHRKLGTYRKIRYIFLTGFNRDQFRCLLGEKTEREFIKPNFEYVSILPTAFDQVDHNKFVFAGRLERAKGIGFLLTVWNRFSGKKLYVFGSGPLEAQVKEAARANPDIIFRGFQGRDTILQALKTAAALIFPSELYEGFPMTLIESFAAGAPVLCTDIGNPADIVRKTRAGFCFRLGDEADFSEKLESVAADPALRAAARRAYETYYTPERNYRMLKRIYDRVCEEGHAGTAC